MKRSTSHSTEFVDLKTGYCEACWQCIEACPHNVLDSVAVLWHKHAVVRHSSQCKGCMKCISVCPCGAITAKTHKEESNKVA